MAVEITREEQGGGRGRYVVTVDGEYAGEQTYRMVDERRVFIHTGIEEAFEGQGLAGQVTRHSLDEARAEGRQIVASCPYVRSYIEKHPEHQDLVDKDLTAKLVD